MQRHSFSLDNDAKASEHGCMECIGINQELRVAVYIPFTPEEAARFRAYLAREDKKAGRFVRTLILRALDADEVPAGAQP